MNTASERCLVAPNKKGHTCLLYSNTDQCMSPDSRLQSMNRTEQNKKIKQWKLTDKTL